MPGSMQSVPLEAPPECAADLILHGGTVLTMDRANRRAEAVAIRRGEIVVVGNDRAALRLAGPRTRVVDLAGRAALPGFIETHSHPMSAGRQRRAGVDVSTPPNETIEDILERVAARVRATPKGDWIQGGRYDDTLLREMRHPTRRDLDRAAPDHPVYLVHVSGHLAAVNTAALVIAGITRDTPDPPGAKIFRDEHGEPTGVLAEDAALSLVSRHLPAATPDEMMEDLAAASAEYVAAGITSCTDASVGPEALAAYRRAVARHRFLPRVYALVNGRAFLNLEAGSLAPLEATAWGLGDDRFRIGAAKLFADGSIQGLTGALSEPYACAPETRGVLIYTPEALAARVRTLHEAGWQIAIHGNGDAAIQAILDAYEAALRAAPRADHRHRIEHCQMAREDQLERMAALGIHASVFVKHVYYWGDRHRDLFIGPQRAARISPLRSAVRRGVRVALHSDCPVTPVAPLAGVWTAVNRITRNGTVLGPEQRVDIEQALRAYTSDAAFLSFEEDRKGTLEPGKLGDVTVLSADPHGVPPDMLDRLQVEMTIIGGEVVWYCTTHR